MLVREKGEGGGGGGTYDQEDKDGLLCIVYSFHQNPSTLSKETANVQKLQVKNKL